MAKRGKEIALQTPVDSQEEWEDLLSKEGLCVVDVYQEWAGPVTPLVPNLRRLKNELGDDLLRFYTAKADTIDSLEKYRGRCEPCFLFYAGGSMVAVIRGANAPLILRTITEQLAQEHKVLDGNAERKTIKDTVIDQLEARDREKEEEEDEQEEAKKEVAVVIIKPDAVLAGQAESILEEMQAQGIEVLRQEERVLTEDEVKNVYIHLQDEPFFEELVGYMTSSKSIVLAITKGKTGQNIINDFRDLMGPMEVEKAKQDKPESLRAKFGSEKYMNAIHGSDSADTAARELAFFFPDFVAPPVDGEPKVQRTLALIRPDAYKNHKEEVIAKIREAGFKIAMSKEIHLDKAQAEEFYKEHQGQEYFEELTNRMSSGPLLALGLAREDAVSGWRHMLGPTKVDEAKEQQPESLRAQFVEEGASINMLHGSDSEDTAKKELEFFFPVEQTVAVIKPDAYGTRSEIIDKIHESGFRIAAKKETTLSREIAEEFYADHQDKEYFSELVEHMVSGPTLFMVLSREDAVEGWRSLIGPTDPEEAKQDPDSLRGKFGQDKLKNALHGSSSKDHAMTQIPKIFGDISFNADGTVREDNEEEAISEQQQINYETSPEHGGQQEDAQAQQEEQKEGETTQEQAQQDQKQEAVEKTEGEAEGQQQSEDKPSEGAGEQTQEEQTPTEQKQEEEKKPADEGQAEQQEQKPAETEQQEAQPKAEEQKQEEAPAEQKQEEAEQKQEEAAPAEQKQEDTTPAEQKQEEATPAEQKQEEATPAEQKQEEGQQQEENKEGDAKQSEEKKEGDN